MPVLAIRPRRTLLPAVIALAMGVLSTIPVAAVTPTPLKANLLKNPGAESGAAGTGTQVLPIPGWKTTSNFTVVAYGTPGYPTETFGDQMFACGPHTAKATAAQVIPIRGHDQQIDKGHIAMDLSVRIAAKGTDKGWATLTFLDAKGKRIGRRTSVVVSDTNDLYSGTGFGQLVPKNTRAMRFTLTGKRASGAYCDVFFDGLELTIRTYPS
jgi:hypothetical protein